MSASNAVKLVYFAWVRERMGRSEETLTLPESVATISQLVLWLRSRGPEYAAAFDKPDVVRAAIDRSHVKPDARIAGAREIAFFPPVTGG
jgi:molybdopterin synthase sulfur carrier subunit